MISGVVLDLEFRRERAADCSEPQIHYTSGLSSGEEWTMNAVFTLGRIALVVIFIISGAQKLLDIAGTAEQIQ